MVEQPRTLLYEKRTLAKNSSFKNNYHTHHIPDWNLSLLSELVRENGLIRTFIKKCSPVPFSSKRLTFSVAYSNDSRILWSWKVPSRNFIRTWYLQEGFPKTYLYKWKLLIKSWDNLLAGRKSGVVKPRQVLAIFLVDRENCVVVEILVRVSRSDSSCLQYV